jgi:hypothetical protein
MTEAKNELITQPDKLKAINFIKRITWPELPDLKEEKIRLILYDLIGTLAAIRDTTIEEISEL